MPGIRLTRSERFDDAFRRLFEEQFRFLFRYLDRLSGDPSLAGDLAQETFIRLFRRGSMPDDARAWLVSVASNLLRDERRRATRRARLLEAVAPGSGFGTARGAPDEDLLAAERRALVRRTLSTLPDRDRQVLLLRYEGCSYRQIARALDLTESSVGTFLARAKRAFQAAFEETRGALD